MKVAELRGHHISRAANQFRGSGACLSATTLSVPWQKTASIVASFKRCQPMSM